jgi:hypothetical protein
MFEEEKEKRDLRTGTTKVGYLLRGFEEGAAMRGEVKRK